MTEASSRSPWLFGPALDVAVFGGSAALGLSLVGVRHFFGLPGELPEWGLVAFVVGVDVAHVYATLFRTYFDREELARRPLRYAGLPVAAYAAGVVLHLWGSAVFWRFLAYVAVFHFVRQQIGWAALYRARTSATRARDKLVDDAAIYAATGYPLIHWHAHLGQARFNWFIEGDFADPSGLAGTLLPAARVVWVAALSAFAAREIGRFATTRRVDVGRLLVVVTTAATWYVGIVATNSDFDFTVTNVLTHGVPYFALVYAHAGAERARGKRTLGAEIVAHGFGAFVAALVVLAFVEEAAWDRFVWHDHAWLFGTGQTLTALSAALVVPLLAVPQVTHYLLDGMIWRRSEAGTEWLRRGMNVGRGGIVPVGGLAVSHRGR